MQSKLPFLISGAGIGGLATALALSRTGWPSLVLERTAVISTAGAGIQLGPNAVKVLRWLGVDEAVRAVASVPSRLVVRNGADGRMLSQMAFGRDMERRHGAPYWVVHRADLQQALLAAVKANGGAGMQIETGREIVDVRKEAADCVHAVDAGGREIAGAALVGADGVWSAIRKTIEPIFAPQYSGYVAYRAVIARDKAGLLGEPVVGAWLSPSAHVVHYPVRSGRDINVVVVKRDPWRAGDWNAAAEVAELAETLMAFAGTLREGVAAAETWRKWALPVPVTLGRWSNGRVVLLGDAAHAMLPFLAQGGVMALEDAAVLAGAVAAEPEHLASAFRAYEDQRRGRVARVQAASTENGRIFHLDGLIATARNLVLRVTPETMLQQRLDWLYGFEASPVTPA